MRLYALALALMASCSSAAVDSQRPSGSGGAAGLGGGQPNSAGGPDTAGTGGLPGATAGSAGSPGGAPAGGSANLAGSSGLGGSAGARESGGAGSGGALAGGAGGAVAVACPSSTAAAVTVVQSGTNFTLSNGLLTVALNGSGLVTQVTKNGRSLMGSGDTLYVSESGGSGYYSITATGRSVVRQSPDLVELSFKDTSAGNHDMNWDLHYVMKRGVSGFYYFLVADTVGRAAATLGELRAVQRFDSGILQNGYNGVRHGQLPTAAQVATFQKATEIQDSTYSLTSAPNPLPGTPYSEGPVFTKYDWASYRTEDLLHGLYGNNFGAWLLSASWEYYTGGSVKQELMVHHDNLILNMFHGGHFGSNQLAQGPSNWQKLYGPNLAYFNTGSDDAVIADAQAQAQVERSQWPYCWMNNSLYPLARATVSGQVVEAHGRATAGVIVELAQPGPLLQQGYDYMFWTQADSAGNFTIRNVRPGAYALHVYATSGTIVVDPTHGEVIKNVSIAAGTSNLGSLTWTPPYHAKLLWSIGASDQKSGEFRVTTATASNTGRMYGPSATAGVWTIPPANLTYTIGTSVPASDWYFAQSTTGTWTVKFNLTNVPPGGGFLTLGLAGASRSPKLNVSCNGTQVIAQTFGNDGSLYRSGLTGGTFQMVTANVPATSLKVGANAFTFQLSNGSGGTGIFYDIVKFESD